MGEGSSVHLRQRLRREQRAVKIRRRRLRFLTLVTLFLLSVSAYAVMSLAEGSTSQVNAGELLVEDDPSSGPVATAGETHPVFAKIQDRNLVLPVSAGEATIIAYSPTSDEKAVPLTPLGSRVNASVVSRGLERVFSGESSIRYYTVGERGRSDVETGAVEIGASPGAVVVSPVSGQITGVRTYQLYGKYEDVQIDIRPEGLGDLTVSLLLIDEPAVTIGQTVTAGKTQLGKVREAQGDLGARLAEYTHDSGSHLHLQVAKGYSEGSSSSLP